jgi:hypothetical protein
MKSAKFILFILLCGHYCPVNSTPRADQRKAKRLAHRKHRVVYDRAVFLGLTLAKDQQIGNIFSRTTSFWGRDFKDTARRESGTCIYTVTDPNLSAPVFVTKVNYDAMGKWGGAVQIIDEGSKTHKPGSDKVRSYADASGIMYNVLIWGRAPKQLFAGQVWQTPIIVPWEFGGAGTQTVRVLQIDPANHTLMLEREGYSDGSYKDDITRLTIWSHDQPYDVKITSGKSHWRGYTVIKSGLVLSDELMTMREVKLSNGRQEFSGFQREYMLLNQMPVMDGPEYY